MKTLKSCNPLAYKEWMDINEKSAEQATSGSHYRAWFKCNKCDFEWKSLVSNRAKGRGCPACANRVVTDKNSLVINCPSLLEEWHDSNDKDPHKLTFGSNFLAKWKCRKCDYVWSARVVDRVKGRGCASCAGQVANNHNRLSTRVPIAILDWDYKKNDKTPNDYAHKSNISVWWICHKCNYKFFTIIANYSKYGCGKCNGFVPNKTNCLASDTVLMKFWSKDNNTDPTQIFRRSSKDIIWECSRCAHKWKMSPHRFSRHRGCIKCDTGSKVSKIALNWLNMVDPEALQEQKIYIGGKHMCVDGYNYNTGVVYEFLGDYWHGNPTVYKGADTNAHNGIKFGVLYSQTFARLNKIRQSGFKLKYIWESEFKT